QTSTVFNFNELPRDALEAFLCDVEIRIGSEIALADTFCQSIDEHAGCRSFKVVAGGIRLVDDLIPQASLGRLIFPNRCGQTVQNSNQRIALRMILWKIIERIDERHRVPTHRTSPDVR